jgi:hypothetical protein
VRRAGPDLPLVLSVHGDHVFGARFGDHAAQSVLRHARLVLVLANSQGTAERCRAAGAQWVEVVHLGTENPASPVSPRPVRCWSRWCTWPHASVTRTCCGQWGACVTGILAALRDRRRWAGAGITGADDSRARGEPGSEEIAAAGGGILLVAPREPARLAEVIDRQLSEPDALSDLRRSARQAVLGRSPGRAAAR